MTISNCASRINRCEKVESYIRTCGVACQPLKIEALNIDRFLKNRIRRQFGRPGSDYRFGVFLSI